MTLFKDRYYLALAVAAFLISFIIYDITKAPTVSFWDCGEFIASSYILGVPHPPGYPVYILIGRIFTLLPIAGAIAVRVNLLSVVGGAFSAFVAFWLIVRIMIGKGQPPRGLQKIGIGIGALSGSLIMAFSKTFWSNAVEAEVYTFSMFLMLLITYFVILWGQAEESFKRDNYLIAISYFAWLSLGVHMTTFIIVIPAVFYMAYIDYKETNLARWPVWIVMLMFVLYAVPLQTDILKFIGIDITRYELESFITIFLLAFLTSGTMALILYIKKSENYKSWFLALTIMLAAAAGFSTQAYIPIRAAEKPAINENSPSDWDSFKGFLERKQYGQESMFHRMFARRASWINQFATHPRFGFLGIFNAQYASPDARVTIYETADKTVNFSLSLAMVYILIFGFYGIFELFRRSPPILSLILIVTLLSTIGMVVYMNFSDGSFNTMIAPIAEVRNRDYFYTPGFMFFAIIIGIGLTGILQALGYFAETASSRKRLLQIAFGAMSLVALLLPIHTAAANFAYNDRRGNYLPQDYAKNILDSCEKDAILFTNGDNDTFPLWYIQEVEEYRRDVRVANLSLLNTPWYIHQLKDQMNVPFGVSDSDIDSLRMFRISGSDRIYRIQDQALQLILTQIQAGGWEIPVYFAITVPEENRLGMDDHLVMEGMAYRVSDTAGKDRVNTDTGMRVFGNTANFRGTAERWEDNDESDRKLILNYTVAIFKIADAFYERGQLDSAMMAADLGASLYPADRPWQIDAYKARIWAARGNFEKVVEIADQSSEGEKIYLSASQDMIKYSDFDTARELLKITLSKYPNSLTAFNNLAAIYYQDADSQSFDKLTAKFRADNAGDPAIVATADQIIARLKQLPPYEQRKQ